MRCNRQIISCLVVGSVLLASLAISNVAMAQSIANVDANQEGKSIAVTYDLSEATDISLYITRDGGKTKTAIPLRFTSGDIGKNVKPGLQKKILWRVLDQYPNQGFQGENISFIVKGSPRMSFFATLNAGYAPDSGFNVGFMAGQLGTIGWYVKGMTTLSLPQSAEYECDENGYIDYIMPAYSGQASVFKAYGVAGITFRLSDPLYVNVGAGYGVRIYEWELTSGQWVRNLPGSYGGFALDAGVVGRLGNIALSAGATLLLRGSADICLGIGYVF